MAVLDADQAGSCSRATRCVQATTGAPWRPPLSMDTLYLLIPLSLVAMFGVLGVFAWAVYGGQFEELDAEGNRILFDPDQAGP